MWINENGVLNSGDQQDGDREATQEEIRKHINGMPTDWLFKLNLELNQKMNEISKVLADDLSAGFTLKESQALAAESQAEVFEDYEVKLAKIKSGINPFEEE